MIHSAHFINRYLVRCRKPLKSKSLILLWIFLLAVWSDARATYFHDLEAINHLSQPSVMSISQDDLGRMWFGTREGINVYDGYKIVFYKGLVRGDHGHKIWLGNNIGYVCRGQDGNMYIQSDNNLYVYDMRQDLFRQLTDGGNTWTVVEDGGNVWFVQKDSIFRWDMQQQCREYMRKAPVKHASSLRVTDQYLCVGSPSGLFLCSYKGEDVKLFLNGIEIFSMFESSDKELWIGTRMEGLYRMKNQTISRVPYSEDGTQGIADAQIREFAEDDAGNIWFGTFTGLQVYRRHTQTYERIDVPPYVDGLNHPSVFSLFKDQDGVIWVGSYYGGVNFFDPKHDGLVHYDYQNQTKHPLYFSLVESILKDNDGNLWLGTDGGGIACLDRDWNLLKQYTADGKLTLPHNNVKVLAYDPKHDQLYIGTYLGGLARYDRRTGQFHHYLTHHYGQPDEMHPGAVIHHLKFWKGDLYVSSRNGIFRLHTGTEHFERISDDRYCEWFDIDDDGTMYVMKAHSFDYFSLDSMALRKTVWMNSYDGYGTLSKVYAYHNQLYICMLGSGLFCFDKQTGHIRHLSKELDAFPSQYCYAVQAVDSTQILVLSDAGLSLLSTTDGRIKTMALDSYATGASVIDDSGLFFDGERVYVGDTKGVTFFTLDEFEQQRLFTPYFSSLLVNNLLIEPGDPTQILTQALPFTQELSLKPHQNNLTFYFHLKGAIYQHTDATCEYKLEGFDEDWTKASEPMIRYTRLHAGNYKLHLRLAGHPETQQTMCIHIATPLYATWWAIMLYLLAIGSAIRYWIWNRQQKHALALSLETGKRKQQALEFSLEKERIEARYAEEINREKLIFFTNISHELRTPLTLIVSYVDSLLEEHLPDVLYHKLQRIKQHSLIMNQLVTDLLDFRKFSQGKGKLVLQELDIERFAYDIYNSFCYYAQHRSIRYTFQAEATHLMGWFDKQQLRKVLTNLLSNAFKYTPNGGTISVKVAKWEDWVKMTVADTGIGIAPEDVPHIFDRFYQGKRQDVTEQMPGTGIGLALTKRLVELHHGQIYVESKQGQGSIFTVLLPLDKNAYEGDEHIDWSNPVTTGQNTMPDTYPGNTCTNLPGTEEEIEKETDDKVQEAIPHKQEHPYTVLLVEDNPEMRAVLKRIFQPHYHVRQARNGQEALEVAHEKMPDLIVSDVMMPVMNGTDLCAAIKNDPDLCHIPVILLTALNTPEQNIQGLNLGADDYITKPFDARILLARAESILRNRMLLRKQINKKPISEMDFSGISLYDQKLLQQVEEVVYRHLDDPEFDIPSLCREAGVGRSTLFSKFKLLMGITPNAFIVHVRLQAAEQMLRTNPALQVVEVSERCGFNSVTYFRQCFKEKYGKAPQTYRREVVQEQQNQE